MREQACADVQLAYAFIFHICENKDYLMKQPYSQDSGICGHASDNRQGVNSITIIFTDYKYCFSHRVIF